MRAASRRRDCVLAICDRRLACGGGCRGRLAGAGSLDGRAGHRRHCRQELQGLTAPGLCCFASNWLCFTAATARCAIALAAVVIEAAPPAVMVVVQAIVMIVM